MSENFEIRFQNIFSTVSEMYDKSPSTFLFELWFNALNRFDIEAIEKAFSAHVQDSDNGKFMPKPADIIRIIEGSTKDLALSAWTKVFKSIGIVGSYQSVVFDDPIIHRVIQDMGGWIRLCQTQEEELPYRSNEFVTRYRGYRASGETPEHPKKLIGITEGDNTVRGYLDFIQDPVLIGNPAEAKRVLLSGSNLPTLQITQMTGFNKIKTHIKQIPSSEA